MSSNRFPIAAGSHRKNLTGQFLPILDISLISRRAARSFLKSPVLASTRLRRRGVLVLILELTVERRAYVFIKAL
jgi:hypothetical protein